MVRSSRRIKFLYGVFSFFTAVILAVPAWAAGEGGASVAGVLGNPVVSGVLLVLGITCSALAIITLGSGVAETGALVCLGLFFLGRYMSGATLWLPLGLLVGGMILVAFEALVIPGHGVSGIIGLLCVAAAVIVSFDDLKLGLLALVASLVASLVGGVLLLRYLPDSSLFKKWAAFSPPVPDSGSKDLQKGDLRLLTGKIGVAKSPLRPGGIADFDGQRVDVLTEGDFVKAGRYIEVIKVEGNKVVVREVPGQDESQS